MRQGIAAAGATPTGLWVLLALTVPLVAAMTVVGTYFGYEIIVFAGLLSLSMVGFLFVRPMIGVALMTAGYMAAAYPSALEALGILSIINLLGVCLLILLLAHVLAERDLSIAVPPPVLVLVGIGVVFLVATLYADVHFPNLQVSRATGRTGYKILDRTDIMTEAFITRLAFLVFLVAFVRARGDVRAIYFAFVGTLLVAIPSAIANWGEGELTHGFRVAASITQGENSNRLGMICCIQMICWWYWFRVRPTALRRVWAMTVLLASMVVISATGSRSTLVGALVTGVVMVVGPRGYRVSLGHAAAGVVLFVVMLLSVAPPQAVERMFAFFPQTRHEVGASSLELRGTALDTAKQIISDHPISGVGLGNFREVARQVYADKYFRPPHNSYLWAGTEGGLVALAGYGLLFWLAFRDFRRGVRFARYDPDTAAIGMAMQRVLVVFLAFSAMADLFLSPFLYVLVGFAYVFRRYMEQYEQVALPRPTPVELEEAA